MGARPWVLAVAMVGACGGSDDGSSSSSGSVAADGGAGTDGSSTNPGPNPVDPARCTAGPATPQAVMEPWAASVCGIALGGTDLLYSTYGGSHWRVAVSGATDPTKISAPAGALDASCTPSVADATEWFVVFTTGIWANRIGTAEWRDLDTQAFPIAVEGDRLYVVTPSIVGWTAKVGGQPITELAQRKDLDPTWNIYGPQLASVDDGYVYFSAVHEVASDGTVTEGISRVPKSGGAKEKLAPTPKRSRQVAVGGDALFFVHGGIYTNAPFRRLERAPKGGGAPTVIDQGPVGDLVSDGSRTYYSTAAGAAGPGVYVIDTACGDAPRLFVAEAREVTHIATDSGHLYWVTGEPADGGGLAQRFWRANR